MGDKGGDWIFFNNIEKSRKGLATKKLSNKTQTNLTKFKKINGVKKQNMIFFELFH